MNNFKTWTQADVDRHNARVSRKCKVCSAPITEGRLGTIYCSGKCASIAWRETSYPYTFLKCSICEKEFKRLRGRQKYCSKECAEKAQREQKKWIGGPGKGWSLGKQYAPRRNCELCGNSFYAPPALIKKGGGRFCSNGCRTRYIGLNPSRFPQMRTRRAKTGKREDLGGKFFRSSWEANYARYLNLMVRAGDIVKWEYEVDTFEFNNIKRGTRFYTPDFKVWHSDTEFVYHEVKGWMDQRSVTRMKRMTKYYPEIKIELIDKKRYSALSRSVSALIPNWEKK